MKQRGSKMNYSSSNMIYGNIRIHNIIKEGVSKRHPLFITT